MSPRPGELENIAEWRTYNPRTGAFLSDMTDILLRFFQDVFYQEKEPRFHFHPGDNPQGSTAEKPQGLVITNESTTNTDSLMRRPAIIVLRRQMSYGNVGFDHLLGVDRATGKQTHTDLVSGSFVVHCVSANGVEAEFIATYVAQAVRTFRRELQRAGFHLIGTQISIGEQTSPGDIISGKGSEDYVDVPVEFPVHYENSWSVQKNAPLLDSILLRLRAALYKPDGTPLVPGSVDENGLPVQGAEGVIVTAWTLEE